MAGIDGAGRSRGVAQTSDLDQTQKGDAAERKGKQRPFAALQNRRGSVEKAVHAREKDAGFKGKIDKNFRSNADGLLRSMKAKSGGKEGAQATARQTTTSQTTTSQTTTSQTTTSQATTRQAAATPAPAKPPRAPQQAAPEQAATQASTPASAQAPQKPPRSEASQTLGRTGAKAAPTKPDRSEASKTSATMPRPQTKPRTVFGAAAEAKATPNPAPRTGIGGEKPIPKTRTLLAQQGQAQTATTKATAQGSYDVLTNASDQRKGIRYPTMKGAEAARKGWRREGRTSGRACAAEAETATDRGRTIHQRRRIQPCQNAQQSAGRADATRIGGFRAHPRAAALEYWYADHEQPESLLPYWHARASSRRAIAAGTAVLATHRRKDGRPAHQKARTEREQATFFRNRRTRGQSKSQEHHAQCRRRRLHRSSEAKCGQRHAAHRSLVRRVRDRRRGIGNKRRRIREN